MELIKDFLERLNAAISIVDNLKMTKPTNFLSDNLDVLSDNLDVLPDNLDVLSDNLDVLPDNLDSLSDKLPEEIKDKIDNIGKRASGKDQINEVILVLCKWKSLSIMQLSEIIGRNEKYMYQYVTPLKTEGKLEYTIPDMPNHPEQAYKTVIEG